MKVLRAKVNDARILTEIKINAYNKEINTYWGRNGGPTGYDSVESQIEIINKFIAYKILLDDKIIGGLFLIPISDSKMRLEDFVIEPSFQRKGYGYNVLNLLQQEYGNIIEWNLSIPVFSLGNQHLYTKFGYVEISRTEDEIEYIKKII